MAPPGQRQRGFAAADGSGQPGSHGAHGGDQLPDSRLRRRRLRRQSPCRCR